MTYLRVSQIAGFNHEMKKSWLTLTNAQDNIYYTYSIQDIHIAITIAIGQNFQGLYWFLCLLVFCFVVLGGAAHTEPELTPIYCLRLLQ